MRITKALVAVSFAFSLAMPLAACGGQTAQSTSSDVASTAQSSTSATAAVDVASWKTLGDALAARTGANNAAGWDENHYICVFDAGNATVRVVAKMAPGMYDKISDLDPTAEDHDQKLNALIGGLELESAEDISADRIPQSELDAYVGKSGQNLMDAGFAFERYYMTGGDQTGASMDKGFFSYSVTFDVTVSEDQAEDEGAAVKDARIAGIECSGTSGVALDPTKVK